MPNTPSTPEPPKAEQSPSTRTGWMARMGMRRGSTAADPASTIVQRERTSTPPSPLEAPVSPPDVQSWPVRRIL